MHRPELAENKWYVVITRANYYKKIIALLEKLGVHFYLPLQRQLHYWSDRKKWVNVPILSPYLFLFTNELDRKLIFQSSDYFRFLQREGKLTTIQEEEVERVRLLCNYSTNMRLEDPLVKKGDQVEIMHGPFSGMRGFAVRENGRSRIIIQLSGLGQFASLEIDSSCLKVS